VAKADDRPTAVWLTKGEWRAAVELIEEALAARRAEAVRRAGSQVIDSKDAANLTEMGQVWRKLKGEVSE
jgi:hypothetical protein